MKSTLKIFASVGALVAAVPMSATAQDSETEDVRDVIIVTSERREQNIQDVSAVVQSFSAEDLLRDGVGAEIRNLNSAVPGLNISNQEGNIEVFIRGIGSANNTELGDPAVAPHINGVYIPRPRGFGSQFYDIASVEVRKGPQGTLRGRNSVGGALNINTAKPVLGDYDGYVQAQFGSHNQRLFEGALSIPLGEAAAIRIAGFSETHDPYFKNGGPLQEIEPAGSEDDVAGRFSFLWQPTDNFSFDFIADYTNEGGTGYSGTNFFQAFAQGNDFDDIDPRSAVYRQVQPLLDNEVYGFTGRMRYDAQAFSIEVLSSFRSVDFYQISGTTNDIAFEGRSDIDITDPSGFDDFGAVYFNTQSDAYVNEIRIFAPDDARFRWSIGGFRLDEDQETGFFSLNDSGIFFSGVEFTTVTDVTSTAGFADGAYDITDDLRVLAGVRYTTEKKSRFGVGGNWTLGLGSDGFGCCFVTRLGTEGFVPLLNNRPTLIAPAAGDNAGAAQFLLQGAVFGGRDTIRQQLAGVIDGTSPNGTCIDNLLTDPTGTQDCPANGQHSFFTVGAPAQQEGDVSDEYVDWRAGVEYDITDDSLLYFTVSTGTKSSGFNDNISPLTAPTFGTESLLAYEVGSKNTFQLGDHYVILNGSFFYYNYDDIVQQTLAQVGGATGAAISSGFSLLNQNVADARIIGVEFEGAVALSGGLNLGVMATYLDSQVKRGTLADVRGQDFGVNDPMDTDMDGCTNVCTADLVGNDLPLVSDFQIIGKLSHSFAFHDGEVDWQVLANYRSSYHLSIFNEDPVVRPIASGITCAGGDASDPIACGFASQQDGFLTLNFNIGFTHDSERWRVEGFVSNMLDEDASTKALFGNSLNQRFLNLPRTGGVRLRVNL